MYALPFPPQLCSISAADCFGVYLNAVKPVQLEVVYYFLCIQRMPREVVHTYLVSLLSQWASELTGKEEQDVVYNSGHSPLISNNQ